MNLDPRMLSGIIALVVILGGAYGVWWLIRRFSQQEETKGERQIKKALSKGDRAAAGRIAYDNGQYERSGRLFKEAGRLPDAGRAFKRGQAWSQAAAIFESLEDWDNAAYCYKKLGDSRGHLRMLKAGGRWVDAAKIAAAEGAFADAAGLMLKAKNKPEAIELFRKAGDKGRAHKVAAEYAEETENYEQAARHYAELQRWDKAIVCFEKAGKVDLAAKVLARTGKVEEAAVKLAGARHHVQAAALYEQLQMWRMAAAQYSQAGETDRAIQCLTMEGDKLAVIKLRVAQGHISEAIRTAESIGASDPIYLEALEIAADLRVETDDLDGALRDLYRALQAPHDDVARVRLTQRASELCLALERPRMGRRLLERIESLIETGSSDAVWYEALSQQFAEMPEEADSLELLTPPVGGGSLSGALNMQVDGGMNAQGTVDFSESTMAYIDQDVGTLEQEDFGVEVGPDGWPQGVPIKLSERYSDLDRFGQGGNGVVFKAVDTLLDRVVVLKFMIDGSMPTEMAKRYFQREIKMAASLSHPNIVHIYDMGNVDDVLYYSMEFVDGRPLTSYMPLNQPVEDVKFISTMIGQLCAALEHAHGKGMIHRDIKPDNVLVSKQGRCKLLDFGLARILDDGFGEQSVLAGTPYYMAPEQIDGSTVDHRADIYAVGVILYRMFSGRLPFAEGNIFVAHALEPVPDPLQYNPDMPKSVIPVIMRCLEKRSVDRYNSCSELNDDLQRALGL